MEWIQQPVRHIFWWRLCWRWVICGLYVEKKMILLLKN